MAVYTSYSNAPEIGFGSPTANPQLDIVEQGFGAPEFLEYTLDGDTFQFRNQTERGHGDPIDEIELVIIERKEKDKLSDHGGEEIKIYGRFDLLYDMMGVTQPVELQPIGPFTFKFVGIDANTTGLEYNCYSGAPGLGAKCFTNTSQNELVFTTPVMKKGQYELKIKYKWREVTYPEPFEVIHRIRNDKTLSIRKSLPEWLNRGDTIDAITPSVQYRKGLESNIAVFTDTFASSLNKIYDNTYTVLTDTYYEGDTSMFVETTLGFPDSGTVRVAGIYDMTYVGKANNRFIGVSFAQNVDLIRPNERVYQTHADFSDIDFFYKLKNSGFFKPSQNIRRSDFERAYNIIDYSERSSEQVIFRYFYEMFKYLNYVKVVNISGNLVSAPNDGTSWNCSHVGRLCKIKNRFYYIIGDTLLSNGQLILDDIGTTYWNGTSIEGPNGFTADEYTIEILPWIIERDSGGRFEIVFEKTVFNTLYGYIDKDYIDLNIFFDALDITYEYGSNMNLGLLVAGGIIDKIKLSRRCEGHFGTYVNQEAAPDGLFIAAQRSYL